MFGVKKYQMQAVEHRGQLFKCQLFDGVGVFLFSSPPHPDPLPPAYSLSGVFLLDRTTKLIVMRTTTSNNNPRLV